MELIYTSGWTRSELKTEQAYYKWLNSIKDGDLVITQEFIPGKKDCLNLGIEGWKFTLGRLNKNTIWDWDTHPVNREQGWRCWWGNDREWGDVFPARLIPNHSDIRLTKVGQSVIGHKPVYEPLYFFNHRYVYLVGFGKTIHDSQRTIEKLYPRSYYTEVNNGYLYHCFAKEKQDIQQEGITFLYSEYLED